jgi:hypothetical protein
MIRGLWYDLRITISNDAQSTNFLVFNGTLGADNIPLFNSTINNNGLATIPINAGRETGSGVACAITTVGLVTQPCQIDYIQTEIEKQLRPNLFR